MRLSCRRGNRRSLKRALGLRVLLNGRPVKAFEADSRAGWVRGYVYLEGLGCGHRIALDADRRPIVQQLHGVVTWTGR